MTLAKYKIKRDFNKTREPKGQTKKPKKSAKLLYVIQKHAARHLHYDFRLELNGVLLSWAVPKGPSLDPTVKRLAVHVEDHPVKYGSFEGIIPQGQYGAGTVKIWDKGEWISEDDNPKKAYKNGNMKFLLKGKKLKGSWKLIRINKNDKTWLLFKGKDVDAKEIKKYDIELNLKPSPVPKEFFPQLATLVDQPPTGKKWLHEIKFDGYRIIAIKNKGKTRLMSRNNIDWTNKFISIANEINKLPIENLIFDGEVVVLDKDKKSNFQALQNAIKNNIDNKFYYYIFDLPYYKKYNLTSLSLLERKKYLQEILKTKSDTLLYSDHIFGSGKKVFEKSCKLGLEGIISKDSTSPYVSKRTTTWLKSKCIKRQEFVIGGYTKPQGARNYFGALLIGTYNKRGELIYHGNVGTGFTEATLKSLHKLLKQNESSDNPFTTKPPRMKQIKWVKPKLIAEVEFTEWTTDGSLRHPSFKGLRNDKKAKNITQEIPIANKKLTNPDKILYPEDNISKQDLANYYNEIQKWILPYLIKRPLTLVRCPDGYKKCFYQRHPSSGRSEYIYLKDISDLLSFVQMGVLEIHPWGSRVDEIEYPDMLIFDLDPAPEVKWKKVVLAAKQIKQSLAKLKLKSFVKTTGGKGLHVVVPIKPEYDWDKVKKFSKTFVNVLEQNNPGDYTSKLSKQQRKGKIFIDYLRNQRGATAVAAFSTRARLHAPVSTPLAWNELTNRFQDTFYTITTLPKRLKKLKKDPWEQFFKIRQSLNLDKYK